MRHHSLLPIIRHRFFLSVGCLAVTLATACGSLLDSDGFAGNYAMESLDSKRLPVIAWTNESGQWTLLGDTLRLESDRWGSWRSVYRFEPAGAEGHAEMVVNTTPVELEVESADRIWLHERFGCPDLANCVMPRSYPVEIFAGALVIQARDGRSRYRRISGAP